VKLQRPRFTIGRMMIAIAVLAIDFTLYKALAKATYSTFLEATVLVILYDVLGAACLAALKKILWPQADLRILRSREILFEDEIKQALEPQRPSVGLVVAAILVMVIFAGFPFGIAVAVLLRGL